MNEKKGAISNAMIVFDVVFDDNIFFVRPDIILALDCLWSNN